MFPVRSGAQWQSADMPILAWTPSVSANDRSGHDEGRSSCARRLDRDRQPGAQERCSDQRRDQARCGRDDRAASVSALGGGAPAAYEIRSLLGVVVQSVGDGYVGDVVLGIQSRARSLGFQPLFFAAEGRAELEAEALEVFLAEQVPELSPSPRQEGLSCCGRPSTRACMSASSTVTPRYHPSSLTPRSRAAQSGIHHGSIPALPTSLICHLEFDEAERQAGDISSPRPRSPHFRGSPWPGCPGRACFGSSDSAGRSRPPIAGLSPC